MSSYCMECSEECPAEDREPLNAETMDALGYSPEPHGEQYQVCPTCYEDIMSELQREGVGV